MIDRYNNFIQSSYNDFVYEVWNILSVKYKNYFSSIRKYRKVESYIHEYKHNLYCLEIINNSTIFDIVIYDLFNFL